jgi:hypothetical protein
MYDQDFFMEMIKDWQASNPEEYNDLKINEPELIDGKWQTIAEDQNNTYLLEDINGNITINYLGKK